MEIILHTGAHRTATTSFQHWLRDNRAVLAEHGTVVWDPVITRVEPFVLFSIPLDEAKDTARARQTTAQQLRREFARLEAEGVKRLLISEENILGGLWRAFSRNALYPEVPQRLMRLRRLFGDRITRFAFTIRDYSAFWGSAVGLMVAREDPLPRATNFRAIAANPRGWADLSREIRAEFPDVPQLIWPFERFMGDPRAQLAAILNAPPVPEGIALSAPVKRNASPAPEQLRAALGEGILLPPAGEPASLPHMGEPAFFLPEELAQLHTRYSADLAWFAQQPAGVTFID